MEAEGLPTTQISLVRMHTEVIQPPRALWVPFELGRPFGTPGEAAFQRRVIRRRSLCSKDRAVRSWKTFRKTRQVKRLWTQRDGIVRSLSMHRRRRIRSSAVWRRLCRSSFINCGHGAIWRAKPGMAARPLGFRRWRLTTLFHSLRGFSTPGGRITHGKLSPFGTHLSTRRKT